MSFWGSSTPEVVKTTMMDFLKVLPPEKCLSPHSPQKIYADAATDLIFEMLS